MQEATQRGNIFQYGKLLMTNYYPLRVLDYCMTIMVMFTVHISLWMAEMSQLDLIGGMNGQYAQIALFVVKCSP